MKMRYYKIIFSDYSETVGKQVCKKDMWADAKKYCRLWDLTETVTDVIEITEAEYTARLK